MYKKRRILPTPVHETIGVGDVISYYEPTVGTRRATVLEVDCDDRLSLKSDLYWAVKLVVSKRCIVQREVSLSTLARLVKDSPNS